MSNLRTSLVRFYQAHPLWCALLLAIAVLTAVTRGDFLSPTWHGIVLAAQLLNSRYEESVLADQNARLQAVYEFLRTPEGQELAARAEVMALKPGERLIVLAEAAQQAPQSRRTLAERVQECLQRWGESVVTRLRWAVRVIILWGGWGPEASWQAKPEAGDIALQEPKQESLAAPLRGSSDARRS